MYWGLDCIRRLGGLGPDNYTKSTYNIYIGSGGSDRDTAIFYDYLSCYFTFAVKTLHLLRHLFIIFNKSYLDSRLLAMSWEKSRQTR